MISYVTSYKDSAHGVIAVMGERWLLVRMGDENRREQGRRALLQAGREVEMRSALADAVAGLFANGLPHPPHELTPDLAERLVGLALLVATARSPVQRDPRTGDIELVLDAEAPTRLVKAFGRLYAGLGAIGLAPAEAWPVVVRVGLDTIPKLRRALLDAFKGQEWRTTTELRADVAHPRSTVHRTLQELHAHGVIELRAGGDGKPDSWRLEPWVAEEMTRAATAPEMSESQESPPLRAFEPSREPITTLTDISGEPPSSAGICARCGRDASRRVPHWQTGDELCPACCRAVAS
jgi:hypothetical protein